MYFKNVNVIQDGDFHIWCFDSIIMIEIIVEHKKNMLFVFYKLNFLIQKSYTQKCRHNDGVLTSIEPNLLYALILIHCIVTQGWLQSLLFSCFIA
jgi:hypothetical protein